MPTIETIGPSGCNYTSPQAWYDAHAGDITADPNAPYIGEIERGFYGSLVMFEATTDAEHYFHLRAKAGDEFRGKLANDDPYEEPPYPILAGVLSLDDYAVCEHVGGKEYSGQGYAFLFNGEGGLLDACVAQDVDADLAEISGFSASGANTRLRNCVAARLTNASGKTIGVYFFGSQGGKAAYDCVVHLLEAAGDAIGIEILDASATVRNCAVGSLAGTTELGVLNSAGGGDVDYNAVSTATAGDAGPHSQTSLVPATEWIEAGAIGTDLHLAGTSVKCRASGGSLWGYSGAPTTDIDGDAIGLDIGIDSLPSDLISWLRPLWEPILPEPPAPSGEQFFAAEPSLWPEPEVITCDKWLGPLWEPVLPEPPAPSGEQFFAAEPSLWPPPETITLDKWFQPLAEPILPEPPASIGLAVMPWEEVNTPLPFLSEWFQPLADPIWPDPSPLDCRPELLINPALFIAHYYVDARGKYRIFNAAEYRFYRSNSGPPSEEDEPWATSATLPSTPAETFADGTWWISCSYFNGCIDDSGFLPLGDRGETFLRLDIDSSVQVGQPPPGPQDWRIEQRAAGVVRIIAWLFDMSDDPPDQWAIAYTINGGDPPEDTPDLTAAMNSGRWIILEYDLPAQADDTTVKIRLQTRRNDGTDEAPVWVYSEDSTVKSITADALGPTAPIHLARWPGKIVES